MQRYKVLKFIPDQELEQELLAANRGGYEILELFRCKDSDCTTIILELSKFGIYEDCYTEKAEELIEDVRTAWTPSE